MKHNEYKQLLQLSLFGELKTEEQSKLKEHLLGCAECRSELEEQKNILELVSSTKKINVDEKVLSAARYQLRGALRSEGSSQYYFGNTIENILRFFTTPLRLAITGVSLLLIGILIGSFLISRTPQPDTIGIDNNNQSTVMNNNLNISNLRFIDSDPSDGEVEFTFEASKPVRLKGKINDPQIQSVLTYAMLYEQNPGSRLNSINAMDTELTLQYDADVKDALITVVMTDNNPGVRREALKLMKKFPFDESVKQAFLYVISNDTSAGLRIEALHSVIEGSKHGFTLNEKELNYLKEKLLHDENNYLQLRAKTILKELN